MDKVGGQDYHPQHNQPVQKQQAPRQKQEQHESRQNGEGHEKHN